ncbi:DUF3618 domain-containing protein [Vallicoccus soli]|uniref:DUF3618 domain-containing protein n=1 Tax=Vallicoccus soli TaxID=2339232 RepID=A0A3A3Z3H2_9ACTN|nr:DUF3618 domain-containing protein [Vallicoccus soli]
MQARGGPLGPEPTGPRPNRSPEQIERDIKATRARLAGTVDDIAERVAPKTLLARAKESARAQVVDPVTGQPRYERLGAVAGVVLLIVTVRVVRARRR